MSDRPDVFGPILSRYVQDARDRLEEEGRAVGNSMVVPGEPAWDDCCNGTVYCRMVTVAPQTNSPSSRGDVGGGGVYLGNGAGCGVTGWTLTMALGTLRCAATQDNRGKAPSAEKITDDGLLQIDDMQSLADVILSSEYTRGLVQYTPFTPEGGCFGGEWTFSARIPFKSLTDWTAPDAA